MSKPKNPGITDLIHEAIATGEKPNLFKYPSGFDPNKFDPKANYTVKPVMCNPGSDVIVRDSNGNETIIYSAPKEIKVGELMSDAEGTKPTGPEIEINITNNVTFRKVK